MKLNVKGLVFVGFAAAVFANAAAFADPTPSTGNKIVTSKTYVDNKIAASVTDGDTTHAPSGDAVHDYVKNATLTITQGERTLGTFSANQGTNDTIDIPTPAEQVQSDWAQNDSAEPDYIKSKPGVFSTTATGFVPQADSDGTKVLSAAGTWVNQTAAANNGTITVSQAGRADQTFTVNQSGNTTITLDNTTYGSFAGSTPGLVPDGTNADATKVLSGAGTWVDLGDNTEYTGSDGVTVTGHNITNSGVRAVTTGTTAGTISVNTNGTSADVAVNGLATVATSGAYSDLTGTPTIGDATITILQGGTTQTFTVNDTAAKTITIADPWTAPASGTCTPEAPCALVLAGGTPTWQPIQQ